MIEHRKRENRNEQKQHSMIESEISLLFLFFVFLFYSYELSDKLVNAENFFMLLEFLRSLNIFLHEAL